MSSGAWEFAVEPAGAAGSTEAFVGLIRQADGRMVLRLPLAYAVGATASKESCLGNLSRVLARFANHYPNEARSRYDRDGFLRSADGKRYGFARTQELGYSKIADFVELIRQLRDPRLIALARTPGLTGFDSRFIGRNLERASYLPDGTPYFDHMWAEPTRMRRTTNDLVGLAAWVALDAVRHLFPGTLDEELSGVLRAEWEVLADHFADDYDLDKDASIFLDRTGRTLPVLQNELEAIARTMPPVLAEARELHDRLDRLLNFAVSAPSGEVWGLRGFHRVWEAACLEHALSLYGAEQIFTCDDELLSGVDISLRRAWRENRERVFAHNGTARRPDLVVRSKDGRFTIIDFKYSLAYSEASFFLKRPSMPTLSELSGAEPAKHHFASSFKLYQDIANLEAYRWLLMQHELRSSDEAAVDLEIWAPSQQESRTECQWVARSYHAPLPGSGFNGLSVVYKSTADIVNGYGERFRIFD